MTNKSLIKIDAYKTVVRGLIKQALEKWKSEPRPLVFTLSLMTSPRGYAGWTTIAIDTRENSDAAADPLQSFLKGRDGGAKLSSGALFENIKKSLAKPLPRRSNPADFRYARFIEHTHDDEFTAWQEVEGWMESAEEDDEGYEANKKLRDHGLAELEKALIELRDDLMRAFSQVGLDPDAECGISSERDWYDHRVKFSERTGR